MTREEAIEILNEFNETDAEWFPKKLKCACRIALKSLVAWNRIERAFPKILTTTFESYIYHVLLGLDEAESEEET